MAPRSPSHEPEVQCPACASLLVLPDGTCAACGAGVPNPLQHPPTLVVPDSVEPVSGWRAWDLDLAEGDSWLRSVTKSSTVWYPRQEVVAECKKSKRSQATRPSHPVPSEDCTCGLYAARTLDHLLGMSYPEYDADAGVFTVIGEVALWGGIVEGSQGWRAERGYPTCLYLPFEAWRYGAQLAASYGVQVKLKNWLGDSFQPVE